MADINSAPTGEEAKEGTSDVSLSNSPIVIGPNTPVARPHMINFLAANPGPRERGVVVERLQQPHVVVPAPWSLFTSHQPEMSMISEQFLPEAMHELHPTLPPWKLRILAIVCNELVIGFTPGPHPRFVPLRSAHLEPAFDYVQSKRELI
jgi:hypothetical protein